MSVVRFLAELFESGRVLVAPAGAATLDEGVDPILVSAEKTAAMNLAGTAPGFSVPAARWAALHFYRACQFLICRDVGAQAIQHAFEEKCPEPHCPQTDYSADLIFQYLPDVVGMTRAVASGDPMVEPLLTLAREWPLSSVGIAGVAPVDVKGFIDHAGLRQLYVDRIVAKADVTRLGEPLVDKAVRQTLGAFPELCKPIAEHFAKADVGGETGERAVLGG
jgi:hypothetical protein